MLGTQQRGDLGDGQDEHQVEKHLGPADALVRYVHLRSFRAGLQWRRRVRRVANIADVGVGHGQSGPDAVVAGQFEQVHPDNGPVEDPVPILVPSPDLTFTAASVNGSPHWAAGDSETVTGIESWIVLGDDGEIVAPAERYLAYLSAPERSPNEIAVKLSRS